MGYIEELRAIIGHRRIILNGSLVILVNHTGRILMQHRKYPYGRWGLPGGLMELGESTIETARREVMEETGLVLGELEFLGVYSGKDYLCQAENGDEWYIVTTAYYTKDFSGDLTINDDESLGFDWFDPDKIPDDVIGSHRKIIEEFIVLKARSIE